MKKWKSVAAIFLIFTMVGCEDAAVVAAKKAEAEAQKVATAAALKAEAEAKKVAAAVKKDEEGSKKAVLARLKDPDSAKFGRFALGGILEGEQTACLTTNAKNGFGGYVGDRQAYLSRSGDEWRVITFLEIDHASCVTMISPRPPSVADQRSIDLL